MKNKDTFASIAETLAKKQAKYQKMLDNASSERERNSATQMLERVIQSRDSLMQENEAMAAAAEGDSFARGGRVPQYWEGGLIDPTDPKLKQAVEQQEGINNILNGFNVSKLSPLNSSMFRGSQFNMASPWDGNTDQRLEMNNIFQNNPFNIGDYPYTAPEESAVEEPSASKTGGTGTKRTASAVEEATEALEHVPGIGSVNYKGTTYGEGPKQYDPKIGYQNLLRMKANSRKPNMWDKLKGMDMKGTGDKLMDVVGMAAPFMDNVAMKKYMDSVKGDVAPEMMSKPYLNTEYNINPQLADARRGQLALSRSLDNSNTSRGVANNNKIGAYAKRIDQVGKLHGVKNNQENRLKNYAAQVHANVDNTNRGLRNDFRQSNVDFDNQKAYMKYANKVNMSEDIAQINEQRLEKRKQEEQLKILAPYLDRYGMFSKHINSSQLEKLMERWGSQKTT